MKSFNRVKQFIEDNGMNISQVEEAINVSNGTIAKWDKANPKISTVIALAEFLNVSVDFLVGLSETPTYDLKVELSPNDLKIVELMHKYELSKTDIKYIVQTIEMIQHYKSQHKS